jgi:hypothetical protein
MTALANQGVNKDTKCSQNNNPHGISVSLVNGNNNNHRKSNLNPLAVHHNIYYERHYINLFKKNTS